MGIRLNEYDEMTPYQLKLCALDYNERKVAEHEEKITLAYMQAYWTIQWLGKKKPQSLEKILGKEKTKKEMTDEQMLEQVKKLNAIFGGTTSKEEVK